MSVRRMDPTNTNLNVNNMNIFRLLAVYQLDWKLLSVSVVYFLFGMPGTLEPRADEPDHKGPIDWCNCP